MRRRSALPPTRRLTPMFENILGDDFGKLTDKLTTQFGFGAEQATTFVKSVVGKVGELIGSGALDLSTLMGKMDTKAVIEKLNPSELALKAGVSAEKAQSALESVVPHLASKAKELTGGGAEFMDKLGGGLGDMLGGLGKKLGGE